MAGVNIYITWSCITNLLMFVTN